MENMNFTSLSSMNVFANCEQLQISKQITNHFEIMSKRVLT